MSKSSLKVLLLVGSIPLLFLLQCLLGGRGEEGEREEEGGRRKEGKG